ncbi:acetylglutamate kinase [Glaciecola siphonariae]|uniref:Acetylglutamate kinase n=1 Tax=Glaciecola siphonariae TaxID=521012 RepID=A0ABV9LY67_9ALTE
MKNKQPTLVIKVGGRFFDELLEQSEHKHPLLHAIKQLQTSGARVVLVHGGGDQVQAQLKALNLQSDKINGLRVTPLHHMPVVAGVLSGYLNKTLVAQAGGLGLSGVGLSLADGDMTRCTPISEALGAVGEPHPNSAVLLNALLAQGMLPIVASIGADDSGQLYNVNADHGAICVAQLLDAQLYLLSDVSGVLDASRQKLPHLSAQTAQQLIVDGVITDGMMVKVRAAQEAADALQQAVTIGSWNDVAALSTGNNSFGTQILPATTT